MAKNEFTKAGYKTTEARSKQMAAIRSSNTKPEIIVRKLLFHHGYRYRLHLKALPGKPDIALTKHKIAILVNGCFWHFHGCHISHIPKSNSAFWREKIKRNLARDKKNVSALLGMGWRVLIIWECAIPSAIKFNKAEILTKLRDFINGTKAADAIAGD